jgi:phage terminase small subunit
MEDLTPKQRIFCEEYVIDWNATRAAIAAGYSEKTATVIGFENLTKPYITAYIDHIQKDLSKLAGVSALMNIRKLKEIAFKESGKEGDQMKAIEVINKMLGFDSAIKIDSKVTVDKELTPEEIKDIKNKLDAL